MTSILIVVAYNGKWKKEDDDFWNWVGDGFSKGFLVNREINFTELIEMIFKQASINRSMFGIGITHKLVSEMHVKTPPMLISNDSEF